MSNSESNFRIMLQAILNKAKSIANIKSDIKAIEPKLPKVKFQGELNRTATQKDINSKIKSIKPKIKLDADSRQAEQKIKEIGKQKAEAVIQAKVDSSQAVSGIKEAQKETKTLWERFSSGISGINLVHMAVQRVTQAIREAIATAKELDAIKTNIQMVSGGSDSDVNAMMSSYNVMAKGLSSTTKDVAQAANEFLRMGESIENTNELIRSSQVLSKIGMIESSDAANYLISSLKGYKIAAENSMDVVSKLTSVDLEAAVSAGGLAEALSKCSNIADNSGVVMNRLIGYTATVGEVTQKSMSEVGNSFQSIFSRMNNIKLGIWTDENGESLSDTEKVLNKLGIQLRDTEDSYRSFDAVLDDVGSRWKDFTKVEQNAISVAIAGTRQRENFEALMNNYGNALKYAETAANSAGSALERYGVYQDSIEAKTNELTAAMESLSTNTISEDLYSGIVEATTGIVEFIDKTNLLKASLAGLVAMGMTKTIVSIGAGFITAAKSTAQLSTAMALFDKGTSVNNLKKIGQACIGLSNNQLKLVLSTKGLRYEQQKQILLNKGVAEAEIEATLTTLGFAAAEDKATVSTFSLKGAFRSLGAVVAASPIGAIMTVASVATMVFTGFNSEMEKARQKVQELGEEFKSTKSDIDSYKSKIEGLRKTINDSSSSIEDVTDARKTLMSVQNELINKFGTEESVIRNVTDAINGQTDALDILTRAKWQEIKNEFNDGDFWNDVANFFQGTNNIERMLSEYGKKNIVLPWVEYAGDMIGITDDMVAKLENIGIDIKVSTDNLQGLRDFDSLTESIVGKKGISLYIEGNAEEIYNKILALQNLTNGDDSFGKFYKNIERHANSYKELTDKYKDFYDQYILYEKILAEDSNYADTFKEITDAAEKYNEAFMSGNEEEIKKVSDEYARLLSNAMATAIANGDSDIATYFENMYPTLKSIVDSWNFSVAFDSNTGDLQGKVQAVLDELKDENGRSLTTEEILGLGEVNKQYQDLVSIAHSYNMTIEEMIELLKERNLISVMDYQGLVGLFGQENIDKLLSEDIEIAYTIKNVGNMTFEELQAEIQKTKEISDDLPKSFEDAWADSFTSENEAVKELGNDLLKLAEKGRLTTEAFNEADSTAGDYFKNLGISAEEAVSKINKLVDESSQLSSMSSQISKISEALGTKRDNGFVSADTLSGFDAEIRGLDSWDRFQEVLGSTTSSYDECQEAANALATEWVNNSDFLAQLTEQNKEYYATQLKAMGIENYEEIIAYAQELNSAKDSLSQASFDLATATAQEVQELISEGEYSALAQQQIWNLALAKQAASSDSLNTADDCQRLLNLAQNAGVTGDAISMLTELMGIYNNLSHGIYGTNTDVLNEITTRAESIKQNILNLLSDNSSETVELKPRIKFGPKAASSAGKSAAKAFTDALDKELAAMDKKMEAGYIDFNDYIQARLGLIEDYYAQGKLSADEYYSYLEKHYDTQLSYMDKVVNAVTRRIDTELDALKQQKEDVENFYKVQIDSLEKEKTLLEEANQERQRQKDLQKSLYDMERARNQRTKLVYSEDKGMHYVADDQSIRDAQENVNNSRYDIQIAEIEKSISNLEEVRDKETSAIDDMISNLESYKNSWNDVTSAYTEEQENLIAAQILGANWETDILNSRLDVLNDFKRQYISIQQEMADATWKFANEQANVDFQAYASGTNNARKGLNLVGEDGTEAYFDNHGHIAIVTEPTLIPMEGGEVVKNKHDTKKLLDPDNLAPVDTIGLADIDGKKAEYTIKVNVETNGEIPNVENASLANAGTITLPDGTVLAPYNPDMDTSEFGKFYKAWNTTYGNIEKNVDEINRTLSQHLIVEHNQQMNEEVNRFINNSNSVVNNTRNMQPVINGGINITCPGVTSQEVARQVGVELNRQFSGFSLIALQESKKK